MKIILGIIITALAWAIAIAVTAIAKEIRTKNPKIKGGIK